MEQAAYDDSEPPTMRLGNHTDDSDPAVDEAEEAVAVGMRLALLAGLVNEITVRPAEFGVGTEVVMSWPVQNRGNGLPRP